MAETGVRHGRALRVYQLLAVLAAGWLAGRLPALLAENRAEEHALAQSLGVAVGEGAGEGAPAAGTVAVDGATADLAARVAAQVAAQVADETIRRLIAAGVRVVSLTYGGWDFHTQIVPATRNQMPPFDKAFATLIRDLDRTGLLNDTIVMVSSEFGRTPKINGDAGRDHWPRVFSVAMAGGGFKRGIVFGSSNATSAEPETEAIEPMDLFATIYHLLGIDHTKWLMAPGNRPLQIMRDGKVRSGLLT